MKASVPWSTWTTSSNGRNSSHVWFEVPTTVTTMNAVFFISCRVLRQKFIDVSEEQFFLLMLNSSACLSASWLLLTSLMLLPRRWKHHVYSKCPPTSIALICVTSQKTVLFNSRHVRILLASRFVLRSIFSERLSARARTHRKFVQQERKYTSWPPPPPPH
jgi:hypothetical protein